MPIELHPMLESDVDAHLDIMWASFGPDLMSVFYPRGLSASDREHMKADTLKALRKGSSKPTEQTIYIKAIDTDLPPASQIVSTAKWQIYPRQRTEEELDRDAAEGGRENMFSEGANVDAMKAFFKELAERRRERFGGEPYVLLSVLVVHPEHQRRGLGALQLKWGLEKADEMGVQAYLESSPKGKGLYAKHGFEEEGMMKFDAREWGREEDVPHTYMVRPVKKQ
jgi:GNAT superfamily N-acetyltransferase